MDRLNETFSNINDKLNLIHKKELEIMNLNFCLLKREFYESKYDSNFYKKLPFEKCLKKIKNFPKEKKKNYLKTGRFPVVSQEISLISGYSNNSKIVFDLKKPVIVFGDHTRVLKYINFRFVRGADGTKIILPIDGVETKYLYYLLKYKMPKTSGYARHYSQLKKIQVTIPSLEVQRDIITKLDKFDLELNKALELIKKNKKNCSALKSAILFKIFQNKAA